MRHLLTPQPPATSLAKPVLACPSTSGRPPSFPSASLLLPPKDANVPPSQGTKAHDMSQDMIIIYLYFGLTDLYISSSHKIYFEITMNSHVRPCCQIAVKVLYNLGAVNLLSHICFVSFEPHNHFRKDTTENQNYLPPLSESVRKLKSTQNQCQRVLQKNLPSAEKFNNLYVILNTVFREHFS